MCQLNKFRLIVFIFSVIITTSCSQKKEAPVRKDALLKKTQSLKVDTSFKKEIPLKKEVPVNNELIKNDSYWKSDAYRLYFRDSDSKHYRAHPATTGLFLSIVREKYVCHQACEEGLTYSYIDKNKTIHIYKDAKLKEIAGEIVITRKSMELSSKRLYYYNYIEVKINNKIKCHFSENPQFFWTEYDEEGLPERDKLGQIVRKEYCFPLHIFNAMVEVNRIHPNSYEIFQGDGTSLFIDKKEIDPLIFVKSISTYDKLKEYDHTEEGIKQSFEALQVAIDEVRHSSFKDYSSKYQITSFENERMARLLDSESILSKQFEAIRSDVTNHFPKFYEYRVHIKGNKLLFFSGRPDYLFFNINETDGSDRMYGSAFPISLNKDKKFAPSGHVIFYSSENWWTLF